MPKRMIFGPVLPEKAEEGDQFTSTATGITYTYTSGIWTDGSVPLPTDNSIEAGEPALSKPAKKPASSSKKKASAKKKE